MTRSRLAARKTSGAQRLLNIGGCFLLTEVYPQVGVKDDLGRRLHGHRSSRRRVPLLRTKIMTPTTGLRHLRLCSSAARSCTERASPAADSAAIDPRATWSAMASGIHYGSTSTAGRLPDPTETSVWMLPTPRTLSPVFAQRMDPAPAVVYEPLGRLGESPRPVAERVYDPGVVRLAGQLRCACPVMTKTGLGRDLS